MSELVTIEHDYRCVYVLGSPYARKTLLPHVKRLHRFDYLVGDTKPNFPLPATVDNADKALNYLHLSLCPFTASDGVPCDPCIDKFIDAIQCDYLDDTLDELDLLIINEWSKWYD